MRILFPPHITLMVNRENILFLKLVLVYQSSIGECESDIFSSCQKVAVLPDLNLFQFNFTNLILFFVILIFVLLILLSKSKIRETAKHFAEISAKISVPLDEGEFSQFDF